MTAVENTPERDGYAGGAVHAAVLINHPAQHFSRAFQLLCCNSALRARVYYWNPATEGLHSSDFGRHIRWHLDLHSGYDWWAPTPTDSAWRRGLALVHRLKQDQPQVILCYGWNSPIARIGVLFATLTNTPLLYYGDSTWQHPVRSRHFRIRKLVLRTLFRASAGALSTGTFNREFYIFHGLDPERIYHGVCPADIEFFSAAARSRPRSLHSNANGRTLVIGFAGKFITNKAPQDIVEAVSRLPRSWNWELWLVGDGPLRAELESLASERGLAERVRFLGFTNTDELAPLMAAIDVMVVPSRNDFRVLVTTEAMAAGAAVVISSGTAVWGVGDLVQHEETGLVYPAGDVDALTTCLRRLIDEPDLRARLAESGRARAMLFGPQDFANTAAAALVSAARKRQHVTHP